MNPQIERNDALERLREMIRPGMAIYVLLRHKNQLGTARWLEFYVVHHQELKCVTWDVSQAIAGTYCRHRDALKVIDAGLDVGFATVEKLSEALFATGAALRHKWL